MGYLDNQLIFAEGQAVTAQGDTPSTKAIQFANPYLGDAGQTNENLWVQAICTTTAVGAGASMTVALQDSADGVTYADVLVGQLFSIPALKAGTTLFALQPPPGMRQWWRIAWRNGGSASFTAGKYDAFITNTLQRNVPVPSGFTVA